jgi:primosomal protein N' (replication factor Y)
VTGDSDPEALVGVAVAVPLRRTFTYRVPESRRADIALGSRVRVPFGRQSLKGTVVEWPAPALEPGVPVKDLAETLAASPSLNAELLELTKFVADYYLCSWGEAIEAALPPDPPARKRPAAGGGAGAPVALPAAVAGPEPNAAQVDVLKTLLPAVAARAFAPFLLCRECGHDFRCDQCSVARTVHNRDRLLVCHYCGQRTTRPARWFR